MLPPVGSLVIGLTTEEFLQTGLTLNTNINMARPQKEFENRVFKVIGYHSSGRDLLVKPYSSNAPDMTRPSNVSVAATRFREV